MNKDERNRVRPIACFYGRGQPVSGIGFDAQLQIDQAVRDCVRRDNFNGISTGEQFPFQLSRALLRARDDPRECHILAAFGVVFGAC